MKNFETYVNILKRKTYSIDKENIIFICIGNGNILWDSIGPLVGSYLKEHLDSKKVLGDMDNNIYSKFHLLYNYPKIQNKFIIAIDSALSYQELIEDIFITNLPIVLGSGVNKIKGRIGDLSIKASISNSNIINKNHIFNLANFIGKCICKALY